MLEHTSHGTATLFHFLLIAFLFAADTLGSIRVQVLIGYLLFRLSYLDFVLRLKRAYYTVIMFAYRAE